MIWPKPTMLGRITCWAVGEHLWHYENEYSCCLCCAKFVNQMVCSRCKEMFGTIVDGKSVNRCAFEDQNRLIPLCTKHCGHSYGY